MATIRTIAITNQKGGSGKTTTAVNLAAALAEKGEKVLLLDLDPQASASSWLGVEDGGRGLLEVLTAGGKLEELVRETTALGVELVPSSSWLVGAERALAGEVGAELVLRKAIGRLPARWDFLLLDCPPSLGLLAVNALAAVGEVLVPVEARTMALRGLADLLRTVEVVRERINPGLEISALLLCRVDRRTRLALDVEESLRAKFGKLVLRAVVRENVRLAEAPSFKQPITTYAPSSTGAEDYREAAAEWLRRRP